MVAALPRLVVGAAASGCGKTTVATGLMAALTRRAHRVAPFKVGPDYIDPGYHTLATGRPGRNLDPVLVGEDRIGPLFAHGCRDADVAVVEGVMGLFDGKVGTAGFGSTAHVAGLLGAPVVLVVDGRGQGRSLAALLHGFRSYDPSVRLAGVVLNQLGSVRHEEVLRDACAEVGLPVLGALRRQDSLAVPSRHLGLVTAAEHGRRAIDTVEAMAEVVAAGVDLDAVLRLAATAQSPPTDTPAPWNAADEIGAHTGDAPGARPVIAMAGGSAFTFGYAEHKELLTAAGAEVITLDPLRDSDFPPATAGLVLPGGFPEQHAAELSGNAALRRAVHSFAAEGKPVHAECGGLLYLARELDGHRMCGVLPVTARMSSRLTLGYRDAVAATDSVLYPTGTRVAGHEFHRTVLESDTRPEAGRQDNPPAPDFHSIVDSSGDVDADAASDFAWHWRSSAGTPAAEGFVTGAVHASYLHIHPAAQPAAVARFVQACAGGRP